MFKDNRKINYCTWGIKYDIEIKFSLFHPQDDDHQGLSLIERASKIDKGIGCTTIVIPNSKDLLVALYLYALCTQTVFCDDKFRELGGPWAPRTLKHNSIAASQAANNTCTMTTGYRYFHLHLDIVKMVVGPLHTYINLEPYIPCYYYHTLH